MTFALNASDSDIAEQLVERLVQGRYTIAEAVRALCGDKEGVDYFIFIRKLREFVEKGQILVYKPGIVASSYIPRAISDNYEEIYWSDLNDKWLPRFDHTKWRYPPPLICLRPDESCWSCEQITLERAICLSANITPDWANYIKDIGVANALKISCGYSPRLTSALRWAQDADCAWRQNNPKEFKATDQVKLAEFARWVIEENSNWVVPDEFEALVRLSEMSNKPSIKVKKGRPNALSEEKIAQLIQMRADKPTLSHDLLADEFGVSRRFVGELLKKRGIN